MTSSVPGQAYLKGLGLLGGHYSKPFLKRDFCCCCVKRSL